MAAGLSTTAAAADEPMKDGDLKTKAGGAQMEAGPATIDVSGYPKAVQETYLLFTENE